MPPLVLATDTSTTRLTVALCRGNEALAEFSGNGEKRHGEQLLDTVERVLDWSGCALAEVDVFAIAQGPGSFTGLRIGMATWKGLALATSKPLVGVCTLASMAWSAPFASRLLVALDARMGEVSAAVYAWSTSGRETLVEPMTAPIETVLDGVTGPLACLGDGATLYWDRIQAQVPDARLAPSLAHYPRASGVALEALRSGLPERPSDAGQDLAPRYGRASQAERLRPAHSA